MTKTVTLQHGCDYNRRIDLLARAAHEMNRVLCISQGDESQVPWDEAPEGIKASCRSGVIFFLNKQCTPQEQHAEWSRFKIAQGYVYGEVKDDVAKTHPCLVEYDQLPQFQRNKDYVFQATILALNASL